MPERLKAAIEKARQSRGENYLDGGGAPKPATGAAMQKPAKSAEPARRSASPREQLWLDLPEVSLDAAAMRKNRIVTSQKTDSSHYNFDVLRTRILMMFRENGWKRLGVTSPTLACGKTVFAANLALSFSRQSEMRVFLADMDLRSPKIGAYLGLKEERLIEWFLSGQTPAQSFLKRVGANLALCVNSNIVRHSAEVTQSERTQETFANVHATYEPDIGIYDLPPVLYGDDAFSFLPNLDAVVMVAAAGQSKVSEIDEAERLLSENTNFLGVILNKSREKNVHAEMYGY